MANIPLFSIRMAITFKRDISHKRCHSPRVQQNHGFFTIRLNFIIQIFTKSILQRNIANSLQINIEQGLIYSIRVVCGLHDKIDEGDTFPIYPTKPQFSLFILVVRDTENLQQNFFLSHTNLCNICHSFLFKQ